jgi:hypothetical protein
MKWYLIKLVFNIDINDGGNRTQFDEQLRIIEASSAADAFYKARSLAKDEEEILINQRGQTVNWKFIDVADVKELELKNGSLLCSKTHVDEDYSEYIKSVHRKSQVLQLRDIALA